MLCWAERYGHGRPSSPIRNVKPCPKLYNSALAPNLHFSKKQSIFSHLIHLTRKETKNPRPKIPKFLTWEESGPTGEKPNYATVFLIPQIQKRTQETPWKLWKYLSSCPEKKVDPSGKSPNWSYIQQPKHLVTFPKSIKFQNLLISTSKELHCIWKNTALVYTFVAKFMRQPQTNIRF